MSSKEKLPSLTQFSSDRPEIEACELVFVTWQIPNLVPEKNLYQLMLQAMWNASRGSAVCPIAHHVFGS